MTPRQAHRLEQQIKAIRQTLAAEKRKFGGYDDSRGLRYLPTRYYLQLGDYEGGLRYTRWFAKAFSDDIGFPDFLFEWSVLLFKTNKLEQAKAKVWQTYCANTYVLDKFFGRPVLPLVKCEWSSMAQPGFADSLSYSHQQADLLDFSQWLQTFMSTDEFQGRQARYLTLQQRLADESDKEIRSYLLAEADGLERWLKFA